MSLTQLMVAQSEKMNNNSRAPDLNLTNSSSEFDPDDMTSTSQDHLNFNNSDPYGTHNYQNHGGRHNSNSSGSHSHANSNHGSHHSNSQHHPPSREKIAATNELNKDYKKAKDMDAFFKNLKAHRITITQHFYLDESVKKTKCRFCVKSGMDRSWSWQTSSDAKKGHLYKFHQRELLDCLYEAQAKNIHRNNVNLPKKHKVLHNSNKENTIYGSQQTISSANFTKEVSLDQINRSHPTFHSPNPPNSAHPATMKPPPIVKSEHNTNSSYSGHNSHASISPNSNNSYKQQPPPPPRSKIFGKGPSKAGPSVPQLKNKYLDVKLERDFEGINQADSPDTKHTKNLASQIAGDFINNEPNLFSSRPPPPVPAKKRRTEQLTFEDSPPDNSNIDYSKDYEIDMLKQKLNQLQREKESLQDEINLHKRHYKTEREERLILEKRLESQGISTAIPKNSKSCDGTCEYAIKNREICDKYLEYHHKFYSILNSDFSAASRIPPSSSSFYDTMSSPYSKPSMSISNSINAIASDSPNNNSGNIGGNNNNINNMNNNSNNINNMPITSNSTSTSIVTNHNSINLNLNVNNNSVPNPETSHSNNHNNHSNHNNNSNPHGRGSSLNSRKSQPPIPNHNPNHQLSQQNSNQNMTSNVGLNDDDYNSNENELENDYLNEEINRPFSHRPHAKPDIMRRASKPMPVPPKAPIKHDNGYHNLSHKNNNMMDIDNIL